MTDQDKRKETAKLSPPSEIRNTENLLNEFGAGQKKTSSGTASNQSASARSAVGAGQANEERKTAASEKTDTPSAETTKKSTASKKATSSKDGASSEGKKGSSDSKKTNGGARSAREEVKTSTASGSTPKKESKEKNGEKDKKTAIDLDNIPRSSRPAHKVIPYVLMILAVFIGVSLLLNLFCNLDNKLAEDPSAHWMGVVGYYICYALFGVFGPAVFVLPLLLVNLAFFWRQYVDHRLTISKIVASLLFMIFFGAVIHVFCLIGLPAEQREMTAAELMRHGAKMTGGGVIGGKLGFFMVHYLNMAGSLILGIFLMLASLFYFLGMTPEHLWERFQMRRTLRSDRAPGVSEQDAEAARNKARMDEKIRRTTQRQVHIDDEEPDEAPTGAVEITRHSTGKKSESDKLAPMPKPHLNPGVENRLFVPGDVSRKLKEAKRAEAAEKAAAAKATASAAAPVANAAAPKTPAVNSAVADPTAAQAPAVPNPAQNRDAAADQIFPKNTEAKPNRKVSKDVRNFDLRNVFIDLDDNEKTQQRTHAPVPPEVPMTAGRSAANPVARPNPTAQGTAPAQRPAVGQAAPAARPVPQSGAPTSVRTPAPAGRPIPAGQPSPATTGRAPSLSSVKPAPNASASAGSASQKPIFRQANNAGQKEYGLSSEEFEKIEANQIQLPKAGVVSKSGAQKTAPDTKASAAAPSAGDKKPAPLVKAPAAKKYVFPPISYLQPGVPMTEENRAEIQASMNQLAETLASFHVRVQEINYSCGPTVTRYEVVLAAGVRVRTVTNLADDIALALRSSGGVRIEAPIPGTNAVGIEVPNKTRSTIYLRDLIESKVFAEAKSKLSACLGADIAGQPLIFDIAKMPHLLIAGTTGSGKSVCINCIIMSLLYKVRPDEVKLVLIDPKKVEFSIYKNIPHLMAPVVTQPKDAAGALQAAVEEMERRFEVFENVGVRDLKGYNEITANDPDMPYIPHMVIIIDELADLMMTAKNEVETAICRIAQKARAAGMHLIIGTQRPSADVVTGLIKANVPSSIAFAVKSQIDSRVILDHGGAEALTGRGDMLFVPIGAMRDTRVQGAFVDDKEVEKICEFIRATNGTAQYDERFTAKLKELAAQCGGKGKSGGDDSLPAGSDGEKGDDPKYADAVRIAVEEKRISTSLLQRKLEVGYSRAAKLIDRMQSEGIVSAPDGSKPRAILITPEEYLQRFVDNAE